jgi:hypothetical protein
MSDEADLSLSDESKQTILDTVSYLDRKHSREDVTPDEAIEYLKGCASYVRAAHAD